MGLNIKVKQKDKNTQIVLVKGSIDSETANELDQVLRKINDTAPKAIILDMEGVDYVSSMGLGVIFKTKKALKEIGSALALVNLQSKVNKIFDSVKAIPESIFASMYDADDYLDSFLKQLSEDD